MAVLCEGKRPLHVLATHMDLNGSHLSIRRLQAPTPAVVFTAVVHVAALLFGTGPATGQSLDNGSSYKSIPGTLEEITVGSKEAVILRNQCLVHTVFNACSAIIARQNEPNFVTDEVVAAALYKRGGLLSWRNQLPEALRDYEEAAQRGDFPFIRQEIAELKKRIRRENPKTEATNAPLNPAVPKIQVRTTRRTTSPPPAKPRVKARETVVLNPKRPDPVKKRPTTIKIWAQAEVHPSGWSTTTEKVIHKSIVPDQTVQVDELTQKTAARNKPRKTKVASVTRKAASATRTASLPTPPIPSRKTSARKPPLKKPPAQKPRAAEKPPAVKKIAAVQKPPMPREPVKTTPPRPPARPAIAVSAPGHDHPIMAASAPDAGRRTAQTHTIKTDFHRYVSDGELAVAEAARIAAAPIAAAPSAKPAASAKSFPPMRLDTFSGADPDSNGPPHRTEANAPANTPAKPPSTAPERAAAKSPPASSAKSSTKPPAQTTSNIFMLILLWVVMLLMAAGIVVAFIGIKRRRAMYAEAALTAPLDLDRSDLPEPWPSDDEFVHELIIPEPVAEAQTENQAAIETETQAAIEVEAEAEAETETEAGTETETEAELEADLDTYDLPEPYLPSREPRLQHSYAPERDLPPLPVPPQDLPAPQPVPQPEPALLVEDLPAPPDRLIILDSRGLYSDQLHDIAESGSAGMPPSGVRTISLHDPACGGWLNPFGTATPYSVMSAANALAAENRINKLVDDQLFLLEALVGRTRVQENRSALRQILRLTNLIPNATFQTLEQVLDCTKWNNYTTYIQQLGTRSSRDFFTFVPRERQLEKISSAISRSLHAITADSHIDRAICGRRESGDNGAAVLLFQVECFGFDMTASNFLRRAALVKAMALLDEQTANQPDRSGTTLVLGALEDFVDDADDIARLKSWAGSKQVTLEFAPATLTLPTFTARETIDDGISAPVTEAAE